ncbi:DNA-directed RNA polymerase subunit alpha [Candidatus Falkowbacteria bacterium]|nr:DNA-directed RNA polymerase subunit alpha [Candidatus Falkowbacteria bacterium]
MEKIALPQKIKFEKGELPNQEVVIIEPCYPGYGITLGNSLRRVLLSSLPGAAVVGVKIEGADHEFMTIPHVKEDVLEIIMNLKSLRLKIHGEQQSVKLELDVHGEKVVTAKDITANSQVEIVNKDLVLAHITDMAGNLKMEIYVQTGRGYETIESREKTKHEIGYIEIDSAFSPVLNVGIAVENVRVGKMTNWDKLILTLTTDGTISIEQAFNDSTKILIDQFSSLLAPAAKTEEIAEEIVEEVEESDEEVDEDGEDHEEKKKRGRPKKA